MSIKNRVIKLEQDKESSGFVIIAVYDGETNAEAYQRFFAKEKIKPKTVIYASPLDVML